MAFRAADLGRTISELSRGNGEDLRDFLDRLGRTGLLFIDDLDKARFTPRVESELFDLLEYRETENLPVVVTTNLKGRELEKMFSKHVGPAIVNRLRRMCIPIDFAPAGFDEAAALAAIQAKIREECAAEAEANPGLPHGGDSVVVRSAKRRNGMDSAPAGTGRKMGHLGRDFPIPSLCV